jgi:hypothetical protein
MAMNATQRFLPGGPITGAQVNVQGLLVYSVTSVPQE